MYRGCFIDTAAGRLYLAVFGDIEGRHVWLYLPPFAEEMNFSRAVMARQARAFEARNQGVVCLDFLGTGDSAGELDQARVTLWLDNIDATLEWIRARGAASVSLWGLRLGGLLAVHYLTQRPATGCRSGLLWKPLLDGRQMMGQFFRLKQVSKSMQGGEKINWLARVRQGETVEVAGYAISPELLADLEALAMPTQLAEEGCPLHWIEISAGGIAPAVERTVQGWPRERLKLNACNERSFWQNPDLYQAPALLKQTLKQTLRQRP
jgi:exosortase A-associated hydrolase 2